MQATALFSGVTRFSNILVVLMLLTLGACMPIPGTAPRPEPTVPLTGHVFYRERMALPPSAELLVTLYRQTSEGRTLISEYRTPTEGKNVPLPFSLACPTNDPSSDRYELEAVLLNKGTPLFATGRPQLVHPGDSGFMIQMQQVTEKTQGLSGVRWKLEALDGKPVAVYADQPEPHLLFDPEGQKGRLAGSDGCNSLLGEYVLKDGGIRFSQLGSSMMFCPQGAAQAQAFVQALSEATTLTRSADRLELRDKNGTRIVLKAADL